MRRIESLIREALKAVQSFPLSSGERDGVRASVNPTATFRLQAVGAPNHINAEL